MYTCGRGAIAADRRLAGEEKKRDERKTDEGSWGLTTSTNQTFLSVALFFGKP